MIPIIIPVRTSDGTGEGPLPPSWGVLGMFIAFGFAGGLFLNLLWWVVGGGSPREVVLEGPGLLIGGLFALVGLVFSGGMFMVEVGDWFGGSNWRLADVGGGVLLFVWGLLVVWVTPPTFVFMVDSAMAYPDPAWAVWGVSAETLRVGKAGTVLWLGGWFGWLAWGSVKRAWRLVRVRA